MSKRQTSTAPMYLAIETPPIIAETMVQKVYSSLLDALKSGMNLHEALNNYMPLLINELDKLLIHPQSPAWNVFRETFTTLWERWFPDIPMPSLTETDSAMTVFHKTRETLVKHWDKLPLPSNKVSRTTTEIEAYVERLLLNFYNSVLTAVFSLMGLQM